jgi:L,D-transpeptidase-like protein
MFVTYCHSAITPYFWMRVATFAALDYHSSTTVYGQSYHDSAGPGQSFPDSRNKTPRSTQEGGLLMSVSWCARAGWGTRARGTVAARGALRKLASVLLAVVIVLAGQVMLTGGAGVAAGQGATVNIDGASLFAKNDANSTYLATMYSGDRVDVLWGPDNGMYEVRYSGTDGWTWAANLTLDADQCCATVAGASGATVWVNTDYLNIRSDASLASTIENVAVNGDSFTTAGDPVNGFQPIYYGNGVAWVWGGYLSWDGSTAAQPAVGGDSGGANAAPSASGGAEHWIDVNRSTGAVSLMIGDQAQATFSGSMGFDQSSDGFYATAIGTYHVYSIYVPLSYTPFAKAYISGWVGFDPDRQNGFHSYTKDANGNIVPGGSGATGGCVALAPGDIDQLDNFASIGMRVTIHW